jgi:hypothetical protein
MTVYAKPTVRSAWGETATGADLTDPGNTYVSAGWQLSVKPPRQYFNWVLNYTFEGIRYLCQRGVPDWDANETYGAAAIVRGANNVLYASAAGGNIGNDPTTSPGNVHWDVPQVAGATNGDNSNRIASTAFVHANYLPIGAPFTALSGSIQNIQVPQGAVIQWQGALTIGGGQVTGTVPEATLLSMQNGNYAAFHYAAQSGQPSGLFGTNDGISAYVWNPSNFSVANSAELGGLSPSAGAGGNTIAQRDPSGYLFSQYFNQASPNNENPSISQVIVTTGADGFFRKANINAMAAALGLGTNFATGNPGWFQVPGTPFIVQAGTVNPNGGTITVTFPKVFPTACIAVLATSSAAPTQCNTFNKNRFNVQISNTGGESDYIAVGY